MNNLKQIAPTLLSVGMIILLLSAMAPLFGFNYPWIKYVYSIGAGFTLVARLLDRYIGESITIRRLYRIQLVSALCFCFSAGLLFYSTSEKDWLAFLTAGAVLQIYTIFRIQSEEKKEAKKK